MLTTTYSLIVFSAEENGTRTKLASLRDHVQQRMKDITVVDRAIIDGVLTQLNHFHECAQCRKIDIYLITRMRKMTLHAGLLLAELESMGLLILNILRSIRGKLVQALEQGGLRVLELCEAVELYCTTVLKKVDKEENALLPMASRILTAEDWFQIARQLLSHNAHIGKTAAVPIATQKTMEWD
ncbi:MAG: hypothetical protein ACOH2K_01810 [Burkholderiaceae bacterium]